MATAGGMPAAVCAARHVVDIEHPLHLKRKVFAVFHHRQISVLMVMTVERQQPAVVDRHSCVIVIFHWPKSFYKG